MENRQKFELFCDTEGQINIFGAFLYMKNEMMRVSDWLAYV
jgi:hypothetical protein